MTFNVSKSIRTHKKIVVKCTPESFYWPAFLWWGRRVRALGIGLLGSNFPLEPSAWEALEFFSWSTTCMEVEKGWVEASNCQRSKKADYDITDVISSVSRVTAPCVASQPGISPWPAEDLTPSCLAWPGRPICSEQGRRSTGELILAFPARTCVPAFRRSCRKTPLLLRMGGFL